MKIENINLSDFCQKMRVLGILLVLLIASTSLLAGESFNVEVRGKGQPIVLIPGLMSNGEIWSDISDELSKTNQLHIVSIAGFAGTPSINDQSLSRVKAELLTYIRHNQLGKPTIIGHSLGGFMAFWLASSSPETIGKIISVDGLPFVGPIFTRSNDSSVESLAPQANLIRSMYSKLSKKQLAAQTEQGIFIQATSKKNQSKIIEMAAQSDPTTTGNMISQLLSTDLRNEIAKIRSAILLIGASGAFTTTEQHRNVESLYRQQLSKAANIKLVMNTNDRHFIMLDNPKWLLSQIQTFLSEAN